MNSSSFITSKNIAKAVVLLIGGLFLASGLLKASSSVELRSVLLFDGIPPKMVTGMTYSVIMGELALGALLICRLGLPVVERAAVVTLLVFSVQLIVFLFVQDPPSCGCLGKMKFFESSQSEAISGLVRNALALGGLLYVRRVTSMKTIPRIV